VCPIVPSIGTKGSSDVGNVSTGARHFSPNWHVNEKWPPTPRIREATLSSAAMKPGDGCQVMRGRHWQCYSMTTPQEDPEILRRRKQEAQHYH
jgi:hypothetical protein